MFASKKAASFVVGSACSLYPNSKLANSFKIGKYMMLSARMMDFDVSPNIYLLTWPLSLPISNQVFLDLLALPNQGPQKNIS